MDLILLLILFVAFNSMLVWVFLRSRKKFIRKMQVPVRIVFYCIYALIFLIGNYSMASVFINLLR